MEIGIAARQYDLKCILTYNYIKTCSVSQVQNAEVPCLWKYKFHVYSHADGVEWGFGEVRGPHVGSSCKACFQIWLPFTWSLSRERQARQSYPQLHIWLTRYAWLIRSQSGKEDIVQPCKWVTCNAGCRRVTLHCEASQDGMMWKRGGHHRLNTAWWHPQPAAKQLTQHNTISISSA